MYFECWEVSVCKGVAAYLLSIHDAVTNYARYKYRCDDLDVFMEQFFHYFSEF